MSMSLERTRETLMAYAQAILARSAYADYFGDDVVYTVMNNGEETRGRAAVERRIDADHEAARELRLRNLIVGEGQATAEADFVSRDGAVTPYCVTYDLADGKITALRLYFAGQVPS